MFLIACKTPCLSSSLSTLAVVRQARDLLLSAFSVLDV
jgi:hypothetical protein